MKHITWLVTLLAVLTISFVGCSKQKGVDTTKLEKSFSTADASTQSTVRNKIVVAIQSEDYTGAMTELNKLATNAKLTAEQQQAIKDTIEQIKKVAGDALKKATDDASKAAGDASKAASDATKALTK